MRSSLRAHGALAAAALALAALMAPNREHDSGAQACATVGRTVRIAGEEALIVWDAEDHTEHFVRRVEFRDVAGDFGFLVPTPTRPSLAEASDEMFTRLYNLYARRPRRAAGPVRHGSGHAVSVVEQVRVAGMDATVLQATDPNALATWLGDHHYPSTPTLSSYLAPYVQRGGYITAFRYDPAQNGPAFGTRAVRLTFQTDVPFYPYAEPSDAPRVAGRVFRLSIIGPLRMDARLGRSPWQAATAFAASVDLSAIQGDLPPGAVPQQAWLTTFEEPSSLRGSDDLVFVPEATQAAVPSTITRMIGTPPATSTTTSTRVEF